MEPSVNAAGTTRHASVSLSGIQPSVSVAPPPLKRSRVDTSINNSTPDVRVRFAWRAGYLLAALGIYLADQASKAWAVKTLRFGDERILINGLVKFVYMENPGIAFGQLQEGGSFGRWFFVVLAGLAAIAVFYYFMQTPRSDDRVLGACGLLLAGILG